MFKTEVLERFLRYVVIDTMSDESLAEKIHPSTEGQWDLLRLLEKELKDIGITDIELDEHGYLLARLQATDSSLPTIAFSSHVDTADDVDGNHVKPRVIENYDGKDIVLNSNYTIEASKNPELAKYVGTSIVVSDGNTLLGCDDKGGVAEIMTAVSYLAKHPEIKHGEVEILFSPDEETGFGMHFFDAKKLHSKAFYTVDGGERYYVELECFNAATVKVHFSGVSYHLGAARGRMVNALTMAASFINALPQAESPEATDGRYGYYCAQQANGNATEMDVTVYLRDFDYDNLLRRIEVLKSIAKAIEGIYHGGKVTVDDKISYLNMGEAAKKNPKAVEAIFEAGKVLGQPLKTEIIRGGTDGSRIAEMAGIPCPNLYTGGHNYHSRFEWAAVDAMSDCTALIVEIVKQWAL
ncbi:MAG: peptidase T [Sphaerochaetaceae bacterium]|nr:peptidase T [Sphaerochaetaceae bacterium]